MAYPKKRHALKLKVPVDHLAGQLKAELFEELVTRLAEQVFPKAKISRNYILRRKNSNGLEAPTSVDLLVEQASSHALVIECKAPYLTAIRVNHKKAHFVPLSPPIQVQNAECRLQNGGGPM